MSSISLDTPVKQHSELIAADMNGEMALMSIENGKYFVLNPVSSRIWELSESPSTASQICQQLQQEFDVEPVQCETEVLTHIQQMISESLIEIAHAPAA